MSLLCLTLTEDHGQQCHPDVHTVLSLTEVGSPRIDVDFLADLEDTGQRMHDDHTTFGTGHDLRGQHQATAALL